MLGINVSCRNPECRHLASASKDGDIRIWDVVLGYSLKTLSSHTKSVTCLKWGGANLLYSASQDKTIKVWRTPDGVLCRTLEGHAHWVNTLALSTEWVLKTGPFDPVEASNFTHNHNSEYEITLVFFSLIYICDKYFSLMLKNYFSEFFTTTC